MPLNKLDNFIKNTEGRILYVSPSDLDSTDSITNTGNSLAQPFKTLQRALLESARFSYVRGASNDFVERTTILLMPGEHIVDNRPGFQIFNDGGNARARSNSGVLSDASTTFNLELESVFDLTQEDNILYKFNSVNGGVIVPRGTSIVGLDLRKTKIRPKYVPNPTNPDTPDSAIFRITGACYFWQFSVFDGTSAVYTDAVDFSTNNISSPTFSHHKLTVFEYADGVNNVTGQTLTDLDMYYAKLSNAFNAGSGRQIDVDEKFPASDDGFAKMRPEWEIVGAFASDPINISTIEAGSGGTPTTQVTVTTSTDHGLSAGTPIKIDGVAPVDYNISTTVQSVDPNNKRVFTYLLPSIRQNLVTPGNASSATVTIETDTVSGASPYIFNISMRSVYGMNGMHADGSKASGFRSMVVAQFTGISLQKDDRAFVKYNKTNRTYDGILVTKEAGAELSTKSSSTDAATVYHLDPNAVYRSGWQQCHIKSSNDAILQIVSVFAIGYHSHFSMLSGSDASITNSNSNFGQLALIGDGFKAEAFDKDNKAFVTSIITPKAIEATESEIDWLRIDVGVTTAVGVSSHLYLLGYKDENVKPPVSAQGFKIGAQYNNGETQGVGIASDRLFVNFSNVTGYGVSESLILMSDKVTTGRAIYNVTAGPTNPGTIFTIGNHNIQTGEKVLLRTKTGDLPENIEPNTVYYAIRHSATEIKLAATFNDANAGDEITAYLGTDLVVITRVTDKVAGDIGHPVQYDSTNSQWYVETAVNNDVFTAIDQLGEDGLKDNPVTTFIKRVSDKRSIDAKLYKLRIVIPKEIVGAKNPEDGFVIQQSSSTGARSNADFTATTLTSSDYEFEKNPGFIASATRAGTTVTIITELPHGLTQNDGIIIRNVTDSTNAAGTFNLGYNGNFTVASVVDDMTFTYEVTTVPGTPFTNDTTVRNISLPRFERSDLQSNLYVYRNEVISEYIEGVQDGIYHATVLNASNAIAEEFTNNQYSQNVVNLYPNLDRDNALSNSNSPSARTFAKRFPLGDAVTNDIQSSITRETLDKTLQKVFIGNDITSVINGPGIATVTFAREHGLSGIATFASLTGGSGHTDGSYQNVKLFNENTLTNWNGATANITVSGNAVTEADIVSHGSGYSAGDFFFDTAAMGGSANAFITVNTAGISTNIGDVVQFTGQPSFDTTDKLHRIVSIPSDNQISIAKTAGDPVISDNQYAFVVGPSATVSSNTALDSATGIVTFTTNSAHGLFAGNLFRILDASNNNLGDYLVSDRVGVNTFTAITNKTVAASVIMKHGMNVNLANTNVESENLSVRSVPFYDNETLEVVAFTSDTQIRVSSPSGVDGITKRFPLGCYIQIGSEIMRVVSSTLGGVNNDEFTVIRNALGSPKETHANGSRIIKIKPLAIEYRRPSYVRASGHTFEYLGYGPGNYSTALPQVQTTTLTEREEFLNQAQERSCGIVVYTGMNSSGDFFIGNQKKSSATGEETTFDTPQPGDEGGSNLDNNIFNEVIVKSRIIVEGGDTNTQVSEFNGPVNFNEKVTVNNELSLNGPLRISDETQSTSTTTGAVTIVGGVGIGKNLNVGGNVSIGGSLSIQTGQGGAAFGNVQIAKTDDQTIDTSSGNLVLNASSGTVQITSTALTANGVTVSSLVNTGNTTLGNAASDLTNINGDLQVTGDITAFFSSDERLKDNITLIDDPLSKVLSISGNTFDWNENSRKEGPDVGLIAQEIQQVLPEAVIERPDGYLAVDYHKVIPLLVESIKELSARIERLENNT